jgi:hypothetical protein
VRLRLRPLLLLLLLLLRLALLLRRAGGRRVRDFASEPASGVHTLS